MKVQLDKMNSSEGVSKMKSPRMKIGLGLVGVLTLSLTMNYFLRPQTSRDADLRQNRGIASRDDEKEFNTEMIKGEHKMAQSLAKSNRGVASLSPGQVSLIESLQVESLGGRLKYQIQRAKENGKVVAINFFSSANSEEKPIYVKPPELLATYKDIWSVNFSDFELETKQGKGTYLLLDQDRNPVGRARFTFNDEGQFTALQIEPIQEK